MLLHDAAIDERREDLISERVSGVRHHPCDFPQRSQTRGDSPP